MQTEKIYQVLLSIIENPTGTANYRYLQDYYRQLGMVREADAFGKLVEELRGFDNTSTHRRE